ncbi:MAG: copper transporter, partial [Actinomycetota bacterium]|nr:copper transporter [Actinomycetota bacterium]
MINIRYHIVSIVAIFLALALGVAVGSAFIDDATIATLENRLDALQDEIDETTEDNEALEAQVARLEQVRESLGAEAGERLLSGRIEEQPLLVITVEGTEADTLRAVRGAIEDSGAALAGTLTVTAAAQPPDGEDLVPLAGLVDSSAAGAEVWNDVWRELVSAAAISATTGEDPAPTTTSTVPTTTTSAPSTTTTAPTGGPLVLQVGRGRRGRRGPGRGGGRRRRGGRAVAGLAG